MKMHKMIDGKTYERVFYDLDPSESTVKAMMKYGERYNINFVKDADGWWAHPYAFSPEAFETCLDNQERRIQE